MALAGPDPGAGMFSAIERGIVRPTQTTLPAPFTRAQVETVPQAMVAESPAMNLSGWSALAAPAERASVIAVSPTVFMMIWFRFFIISVLSVLVRSPDEGTQATARVFH